MFYNQPQQKALQFLSIASSLNKFNPIKISFNRFYLKLPFNLNYELPRALYEITLDSI